MKLFDKFRCWYQYKKHGIGGMSGYCFDDDGCLRFTFNDYMKNWNNRYCVRQ